MARLPMADSESGASIASNEAARLAFAAALADAVAAAWALAAACMVADKFKLAIALSDRLPIAACRPRLRSA